MKIPTWKRWLSHIHEIKLEAAETEQNPDLLLTLRNGRFCLSTPNAIYSYGDLYRNFSRTFKKMDLDSRPISTVLVLGFGLGSVPFMLEQVFHKKYHFTGVEFDEIIVSWASKYVLPGLKSPVEIILADALVYAEICQEKFDLIVMDIFLDNKIPVEFETSDFLGNLKYMLKEGGLVLYNRLAFSDLDKKQTLAFFENIFKPIFPAGKYFDLGGNWMLRSH